MSYKWTEADVAFALNLRRRGQTYEQIGLAMGRSGDAIWRRISGESNAKPETVGARKAPCRHCGRSVWLGRFERWCMSCRPAMSSYDHQYAL